MVGKLNEVEDLTREIELMKDLEHPNIVAYIGASVSNFLVPMFMCVYMFMHMYSVCLCMGIVCMHVCMCLYVCICIYASIYM